jgi:septum formation protein
MEFILASNSPRRKEILSMLDIEYEQFTSDIVEVIDESISPEKNAMSIAFQKALIISKDFPDKTIIAADTIVVIDNEILGKPKDKEDALRMLKLLNNKKHFVYSGIALINLKKNIKVVDYEKTEVIFKNNSLSILDGYIATNEPFGKAGSYAIQGKGIILIEKFDGCFFNVIGLPINKLNDNLIKYFDYSIL